MEFWLSRCGVRSRDPDPLLFPYASFKIVALVGLIIFGLVLDLGGARLKSGEFDRVGFRYWRAPIGPMGHGVKGNIVDPNPTQTFLGFWATLVRVLFAYEGMELVG